MKRQWIIGAMLIGLLISGCTEGREGSVTKESLLETESEQLYAQLEQLQAELLALRRMQQLGRQSSKRIKQRSP
ncbi:hypothetical protein D3P07_17325 [Paenibacillus sp. 1011MAR3C5]|uniref:hypothetical protein n=1 Tax=Paenibacillus sp. 1011MAR3C5 TaxID=1675787 RepID=UPI000E6D05C7|nr:hypothetical protein [Paenibacillus sp. 1011MAR3C5]RJE86942.1 hypothetical protein D3P07_17325 [Paenibacillus sp. 1011MAR3C5]